MASVEQDLRLWVHIASPLDANAYGDSQPYTTPKKIKAGLTSDTIFRSRYFRGDEVYSEAELITVHPVRQGDRIWMMGKDTSKIEESNLVEHTDEVYNINGQISYYVTRL